MLENNPQDPRSLCRTETDPCTGEVTVTNAEDDPWDTEVLLELPPKGPAAPATLQEACELRHSDIVNATRVFSRLH